MLNIAYTHASVVLVIFHYYVLQNKQSDRLKSTLMTTDFKRNSSGRTRIYEYSPPQLTL